MNWISVQDIIIMLLDAYGWFSLRPGVSQTGVLPEVLKTASQVNHVLYRSVASNLTSPLVAVVHSSIHLE